MSAGVGAALGGERGDPESGTLPKSEVVPFLRPDLVVGRGASPGLFELADPKGGKRLVLYEFELSVARMLDGHRRVADVMENGDRLGIPVDPGGLTKFIGLLKHHGFLAPPGTRPAKSRAGPWAKRREWDATTRSRFQRAVKLVRSGRPDEAVAGFRQILASDPGNPEALEMLALIAAGHALAARPIGEVFQRPPRLTVASSASGIALAAAAVAVLVVAVALTWRLVAPGSDRGLVSEPTRLVVPGPGGSPRGRRAAAASLVETPTNVPSPAPVQALPARRSAPVERRWHPALAEVRSPTAGVLVWPAPMPLRVARGERLGDVRVVKGPTNPGPEARRRLEELERLAGEDPVYQEFLEKERAALAGGTAGGRTFGVAAPAAGQLTPLARTETSVGAGDVVARIVDADSWRLSVLVQGTPPSPQADCEVEGDGAADRAACQVLEALAGDGHFQITVAVSASAAPWFENARSPYVRIAVTDAGAVADPGKGRP